jgi:hypothetical protein
MYPFLALLKYRLNYCAHYLEHGYSCRRQHTQRVFGYAVLCPFS